MRRGLWWAMALCLGTSLAAEPFPKVSDANQQLIGATTPAPEAAVETSLTNDLKVAYRRAVALHLAHKSALAAEAFSAVAWRSASLRVVLTPRQLDSLVWNRAYELSSLGRTDEALELEQFRLTALARPEGWDLVLPPGLGVSPLKNDADRLTISANAHEEVMLVLGLKDQFEPAATHRDQAIAAYRQMGQDDLAARVALESLGQTAGAERWSQAVEAWKSLEPFATDLKSRKPSAYFGARRQYLWALVQTQDLATALAVSDQDLADAQALGYRDDQSADFEAVNAELHRQAGR